MRRLFLALIGVSALLVVVALGIVVFGGGDGGDDEPRVASRSEETPSPDVPAASPTTGTPPSPTATPGVSGPTGSASGPAQHEGQRALEIVEVLTKEPRVSGTPAEARAAEYIAGLFRSYGYTTEIMEFEFDGDRFRAGEAFAEGRAIEALTLSGSPGGEVEAAAAYVGLADEAGIGGQDLTGKVAVADRGDLNFSDKYRNTRDAGAIGLIVVNNRPGPFSGNLTVTATFPVVGVSQEEGAAILTAAKAGRTVGIKAPGTTGLTRALNVIAKASEGAQCRILVGGHFDSVPGAPGANDNASGTANVIELARATAVDGVDEGLCFATFGAEESGLYGSKALVERMEEAGALPQYMINLDVTGIGDEVEVIGSSSITTDAVDLAKALGIDAAKSQLPPNSGSDHESFVNAGVEVVFLTSGEFATIHSPQDVHGDIDMGMLDRIGDTALALINRLLPEVAQG